MSAPIRKSVPRTRGGLKRPLDVHLGTNEQEYELMARESWLAEQSIAEATRRKWCTPGWEKRLEKAKLECRKLGEPDETFMHPKIRAAMEKDKRKVLAA